MKIFVLLLASGAIISCEDVIPIDLDEGDAQLVVDAWITDSPGEQIIKLRTTEAYFNNEALPAVINADVSISDSDGNTYKFTHKSNGDYVWSPSLNDTIGKVGRNYTLSIQYNNQEYIATSEMNPVPVIDSIGVEYRTANGPNPEGYYAVLYAFDIKGRSDYYWIKSYRNKKINNKPSEINIAADAAFPPNGTADGFLFIPPIRFGITSFGEPYIVGDTVNVEILSITNETYNFIAEAKDQMINSGLFAKPPVNVRTNIINKTNSENKAVGWFCSSAIAQSERIIK